MTIHHWQLNTPLDAIIFDCDGTLCDIEGIDEIAKQNHVGEAVKALTHEAMEKTGLNPELYEQRLFLVQPTQPQVDQLGKLYIEHLAPEAYEVIQILSKIKKSIFIVSAGLAPAVQQLGQYLKLPIENVLAVDITFDNQGKFQNYDKESPLLRNEGKRILVSKIKERFKRIGYIGDGLNDLSALEVVDRFVGYGGNQYRENIAVRCEFYLQESSFAQLLPLFLSIEEAKKLTPAERNLFDYGVNMLECTQNN